MLIRSESCLLVLLCDDLVNVLWPSASFVTLRATRGGRKQVVTSSFFDLESLESESEETAVSLCQLEAGIGTQKCWLLY